MTWTYSGDPTSSSADAVRFLVGDTITDDPQLQDAEIAYLLSEEGNSARRAAVRAAETLAAKFSRQINKSVGALRLDAEARAKHYTDLAILLKARFVATTVAPYAGGLSHDEKDEAYLNPDLVQPDFKRDMQTFGPGISPSTPEDLLR